ncbi:hypothetical protein QF037_005337 [Streptomyces canus]|nr:hypothetical protein [Streptomyces canus]
MHTELTWFTSSDSADEGAACLGTAPAPTVR